MSGEGINAEENLNRLDEHHITAHLFLKPTRVLTLHGTLVDVFMVSAGHVGTTKFNIKLKWLRTCLQQMPLDLEDNGLMQYARCYILYLLGGVLLPDKANNTVHVRYLPLLADYDGICTYSWGSAVLCWLYRAMCLATEYSVEGMAGCHTWAGKKGQNDYAEQRLLRHRLRLDNMQVDEFVWQPYMDPQILSRVPAEFLGHPHGDFYTAVVPLIFFRWIEILNVDRVLRQFGGKQGLPNPPLNIDTFHRQSARNDDGWWPVWANRRSDAYRLHIDHADTLRPSQDYYRWYCNRTRMFLSAPDAFHDPRQEVVPAGAPEEYGRGPVVNLPPVPRDHRRRHPRRGRVEEQTDPGEDRPDLLEEDRSGFEADMGYHPPPQPPPVPGDYYYYPQPFCAGVLEDTRPPTSSTGVGGMVSRCRGCVSGTASASSPLNSSMSSSSEVSAMPTSGCLSNPSKVEGEGCGSRRFAFCSSTTNALKLGLRALLISGPGTKSAAPRFLTPSTLLELDELPPIS
ncbi:hypothetical protein Ahy_A07g031215 [Arachis hypogaea]|uniref:Aminotransferase-like plant mobile domain-containing protein n=1 Tax=Arachis hypogaea TaxID=3818 RepID=A0A445C380_ARAHY|nr:hypothetical protein Ahy_A07g031215 [Arachis hypogaea]